MAANKLHFSTDLDGTGFQRGLSLINNSLGTFKNAIATAFGGIAIGHLVKSTIEWAGTLQDSADALGVNVEYLQKLQNGAKLAGSDIQDVTRFILAMNKSRSAAATDPEGQKGKAFSSAYSRLGISSSDIASLSTQDFMQKIVDAFKNGATTQSVNDVQIVGGKAARGLAAAFANQFQSDTPILSQSLVEQLDDLGDNLTSFGKTMMVTIAPAIIWATEKLRDFVNWIKQVGAFLGGIVGYTLDNGFSGQAGNAFTAGGQAALDEENRQREEKQRTDAALAAVKEARRRRETEPPKFEALLKPEKQKLSSDANKRTPYSDALLAVGNFLGAGKNAVNTIAEKQLQEAMRTNDKLDTIANKLDSVVSAVDGIQSDGIDVGF